MDITKQTPSEIDTKLAEVEYEMMKVAGRVRSATKYVERGEAGDLAVAYMLDEQRAQLAKSLARFEELAAERDALNAEFTRRGGWKRYFLVTNTNGHVHRGRNCSSCFATTPFAWLPELSDCDEREMVAQYGMKACTVCFPDAPTTPEWKKAEADAKAEAEAKAAAYCKGSGSYPTEVARNGRYGRCTECGQMANLLKYGDLRKHKAA